MMNGIVLHPTYEIRDGKAYVQLYGKLNNNETFLVETEYKAYFYIEKEQVNDFITDYEDTNLRTLQGKEVVKISLNTPPDVKEIRSKLHENKIRTYEADIRFAYRYLIDNNLRLAINIEGDYEKGDRIDRIYKNPVVKPGTWSGKLNVLSIDIETDYDANQLWSVSITNGLVRKKIIVGKKVKGAYCCEDEKSALELLNKLILEIDPDVITGWNVIDFDLKVLHDLYRKYSLEMDWSRTAKRLVKIRQQTDYFRDSTAEITGRVVLDGIHLLKWNFVKLDSYTLENASQELLGEGKLLAGGDRFKEIKDAYNDNPELLLDYNLRDAELVLEILSKTDVLNLTLERSLLTGMPLDRIKASIASLDMVYLPELHKKGYVASTSGYAVKQEPITGGFVMKSKPGIYDNVIVCDFKSLYPSIIRTLHIDPLAYYTAEADCIRAENGACFSRRNYILPEILGLLAKEREIAKKQGKQLKQYAIKILMNSFFGVLASPNCRFFSMEIANAITTTGQYLIKQTASFIRKKGYDVIYGDTDSIFIDLKEEDTESALKAGFEVEKLVNAFIEDLVSERYKTDNYLQIEFEKLFKVFLMPRTRSGQASKKRYAGLVVDKDGERVEITGLEFVRRDWTDLAKEFQMKLLDYVFHKKDPKSYIRTFVDEVKQGKYDDLLVYRKALRKKLSDYTKTTPPHVKAARKLDRIDNSIIEYYMTVNGPEPKQNLKHRIDYDHYIEKQLKPIADSILVFYDTDFDEVIRGTTQKGLFDF